MNDSKLVKTTILLKWLRDIFTPIIKITPIHQLFKLLLLYFIIVTIKKGLEVYVLQSKIVSNDFFEIDIARTTA